MKTAFILVLLLAMASVMVDAFVVCRRRKAKRAVDEALKALEDAKRECDKQIAKWDCNRRLQNCNRRLQKKEEKRNG